MRRALTALLVSSTSAYANPAITVDLPGGCTMDFVWIEPGVFLMGAPDDEPGRDYDGDEGPQRQVQISRGFWLGRCEVTQGQWQAVMRAAPWAGQPNVRQAYASPATYVSWDDVQTFVDAANRHAGGLRYRLPTEAEWEYACRAGSSSPWCFGDDAERLSAYAWFRDNARLAGEPYPHPAGTRTPNAWGLFDMHGNVWEWVQDWYGPYPSTAETDPGGPPRGLWRVNRGGDYYGSAPHTRSANRNYNEPEYRYHGLGFRLLRMGPAPTMVQPQRWGGPEGMDTAGPMPGPRVIEMSRAGNCRSPSWMSTSAIPVRRPAR